VPTPARSLALRVLLRLEGGGVTLSRALASPAVEALPPQERDFLHELVLGTLRHRGSIDHALAPLLSRPLQDLDAPVLATLRLGAQQLLHLRTPARAAVHESVGLAREMQPRAAGLVNAVLRRLASEGPPSEPCAEVAPLEWLTTAGSLPRWLAERWLQQLGPHTAVARARAALAPARTFVRLNPRDTDAAAALRDAGIALAPQPVPGAFEALAGRLAPLAARGIVYAQDLGSQLVAGLLPARGLLYDACAAPGGKALALADAAADRGLVVAGEPTPRRLASLADIVHRWRADNVRIVAADAERPPLRRRAFAGVLLDAPCSGLGTLARRPDIRWRCQPGQVEQQAERQLRLLESVAPLVAPGGVLAYSVCSLEPDEGEQVVRAFLEARTEFAIDPLPAWALPYGDDGLVRTLPERDGCDGFFAARLRRSGVW
jgi:16S rRNA (cytosine967-C5)-methyltransferase